MQVLVEYWTFDALLPVSACHTPSNGNRNSDVNGVRISRLLGILSQTCNMA